MNWQPAGWQPDGWQPSGWQPESGGETPAEVPVRLIARPRITTLIAKGVRVGSSQYQERDPMVDVVVPIVAGVDETFEFDWRPYIVRPWRREGAYVVGNIVRPQRGTGFYYQVTAIADAQAIGLSSNARPDWPTQEAQEVVDGSLTWTTISPGAAAIPSISLSTWELDAGISNVEDSIDGLYTRIKISADSEGEQYRVKNIITLSTGEQEADDFVLSVLDPADV